MNDMNEIIYEPQKVRFKIFRVYEVKPGAFFLTRLLFAFDSEGRAWQQNIFAALTGVFVPVALMLDFASLIVYYSAKILYKMFCGVWRVILYAAKVVLNNFLGVFLKVVTVLLILLITWLKWHEITSFIKNLF